MTVTGQIADLLTTSVFCKAVGHARSSHINFPCFPILRYLGKELCSREENSPTSSIRRATDDFILSMVLFQNRRTEYLNNVH
jgi:hypothetical protein